MVFFIQNIPGLNMTAKITATIILVVAFLADTLHIMARLKLDEREVLHEAIAERNAMWAMVFTLAMGLAFQISSGAVKHKVEFDPVIAAALIIALIVKSASNIYLERKG